MQSLAGRLRVDTLVIYSLLAFEYERYLREIVSRLLTRSTADVHACSLIGPEISVDDGPNNKTTLYLVLVRDIANDLGLLAPWEGVRGEEKIPIPAISHERQSIYLAHGRLTE